MKKPTGRIEGNDLVLTRTFNAPIEDVWTSITKSESTARWFGSWTGKPGAGNWIKVKMTFEADGPESDAYIDVCEAPRHLGLKTKYGESEWHMELTLTQHGDVTTLQFVHHLADKSLAKDAGPGWEYYLDNLVASRTGEPLPKFDEYYPSQKEHYTAE